MCFDGNYILSESKMIAKRGLNMAVINNNTLSVEDIRTFDIYESDEIMQRYLKLGVQDGHLILASTMDEASFHLTDEGRKILQRYGSALITKLSFRDNFVMIGQKGLQQGSAIEMHRSREDGKEFGETVEVNGCLKIPLGTLIPIVVTEDERIVLAGGSLAGQDKPNCGVKTACENNTFSVQMFTGIENKYMAKVCVNGKYVFGEGLNDAGRGLNIAVVSSKTMDVIRVGHFDTFGTDSSNLEIFIEMLTDHDIIVVVTYDEASKNFDLASQKLFQALGSSYASKLSFRDAWVFVGQHGINGYSSIEEISPAFGNWPKPIDKIMCIPSTLTGSNLPLPDPPKSDPV
jgi:beta-1,2-N-acetylglucosaminyltransferase